MEFFILLLRGGDFGVAFSSSGDLSSSLSAEDYTLWLQAMQRRGSSQLPELKR